MFSIKDHPIMVILRLIIVAFLAGGGAYIWLEEKLEKKINEKIEPLQKKYYLTNITIMMELYLCQKRQNLPFINL